MTLCRRWPWQHPAACGSYRRTIRQLVWYRASSQRVLYGRQRSLTATMHPGSHPASPSMEPTGYVRFNNAPSPFASRANSLTHETHELLDSVSEEGGASPSNGHHERGPAVTWHAWLTRLWPQRKQVPHYQSQYLTLIPLSGRAAVHFLFPMRHCHTLMHTGWPKQCGCSLHAPLPTKTPLRWASCNGRMLALTVPVLAAVQTRGSSPGEPSS